MKANGVYFLFVGIILFHLGSNLIEARSHHWNRVKQLVHARDELENVTNSSEIPEHWENTSSVDWILEHYDLDGDGALDSEEFESYFTAIFPDMDHDDHGDEGHDDDHDDDHDEDHDDDHDEDNQKTAAKRYLRDEHIDEHGHELVECPTDEELFTWTTTASWLTWSCALFQPTCWS